MKDFLVYFFGAGSEQEFALFTVAHFAPILIMLAVIYLIYRKREALRNCAHEQSFRYAIAFALIIAEMSYYWRLVAMPSLGPSAVENLPIGVCTWAAIFCSFMLIGKSQSLFDFCYFWLLSGSVFALLTPTPLNYTGPTRYRYYQFWVEHTFTFIAIFYMIFVHGMRPTVKSAIKSYIALAVMAVVAYIANRMIGSGANYLFMARPEAAPSVLDILPPNFGLRLAIMAAVITALYGLAYLPWYLKDRRSSKVPVA